MLPASNKGIGMSLGFPDVCLTPPVPLPVPYPNIALNVLMAIFSPVVKVSMLPALNMAAFTPMTMGDEAGLAHPTFKGTGRYTMGNPIVHIDMLPAINLLCPTTGNNFNDPLGLVVMPSLTNVFFTYRAGGGEEGILPIPAVDSQLLSLEPGDGPVRTAWLGEGVGYLAIRVFSLDVPARVYSAIRALEAEGLTTLVLDVRGNPGGELTAFLELAGDFLEPDSVVARVIDVDGDETAHRSRSSRPYRVPVWILVDRSTASAAELFAGCLQAHGRAVILGETTYGKGTAQQFLSSPSAEEAVTWATVTLPDGTPIHGVGVRPDIELQRPQHEREV
jgi:carboxyl-terminal processing protease